MRMDLWLIPQKLKVCIDLEDSLRDEEEEILEIKDVITEEEYADLKEFMISKIASDEEYFSLDINGTSHLVRFGVVSHSKREDGIHIRGPLVYKAYDDKQVESDYGNDMQHNLNNQSILTAIRFNNLTEMLMQKGVLTKEEVAEIKEVPDKERIERRIDFATF